MRRFHNGFQLLANVSSKELTLKMIGKGFYSKWVEISFEQFITTQTHVGMDE